MADIRAIKSPAVLAAEARRVARAAEDAARTEMFIESCVNNVNLTLQKRVRLAVEYLRTKVVVNISRPVTKRPFSREVQEKGADGKIRKKIRHYVSITDRSKPGEFPKADTTLLMKSIFTETVVDDNVVTGYVGTPLDYGLRLEIQQNRSFLLRTFNEERETIVRMVIGTGKEELIS